MREGGGGGGQGVCLLLVHVMRLDERAGGTRE